MIGLVWLSLIHRLNGYTTDGRFVQQSMYNGDTVADHVNFVGEKGCLQRTHDTFFHYFPWSCVAAVISDGGLFCRTGPKVKCNYFGMLRVARTEAIAR